MTHRLFVAAALGALGCGTASAALIEPAQPVFEVLPGAEVRVLWLLRDTATPLFGYSLDLQPAAPGGGTTGAVSIDTAQTNFFPARNVIQAGGADLDPLFSVIQPSGPGGIFVSTNTADLSTVVSVEGVNDALAEVVLLASADSQGDFVFNLGQGTALSDANGFPVPFTGSSVTIRVVPAPGAAASILCTLLIATRRRRD